MEDHFPWARSGSNGFAGKDSDRFWNIALPPLPGFQVSGKTNSKDET
jgi:hypothetical protein